jgi:peptidoglycan/xylan/chitin deacetylase (PgdA/CDA1 family)
VAGTSYPRFTLGLAPSATEIPVFVYHCVTQGSLTADLLFLLDNGYRALRLSEYFALSRRGEGAKAVLLTFDDARRNFFEVALPVLQHHGIPATLFVPTFWADQGGAPRTCGGDRFMSWHQIRAAGATGLIDVECHGHRHALVPVSDRLVGYATPQTLRTYDVFDWPMRRQDGAAQLGFPPLGTPIYQAEPLLSADRCVVEDEAATRRCAAEVENGGGAAFFDRADWRKRLSVVHASAPNRPLPLEAIAQRDLVASEFAQAHATFVRELGRAPRFFAYPWRLGSATSLALARDYGFAAVFGVALDVRRVRHLAPPLPVFCRYKSDWLRSLPGRGRQRLIDVIRTKVADFRTTQHLAH